MKYCILSIFSKHLLDKIEVSLISDKSYVYFTRRTIYVVDCISLSSFYNEKYFRKDCTENQNRLLLVSNPFPKVVSFMKLCGTLW